MQEDRSPIDPSRSWNVALYTGAKTRVLGRACENTIGAVLLVSSVYLQRYNMLIEEVGADELTQV